MSPAFDIKEADTNVTHVIPQHVANGALYLYAAWAREPSAFMDGLMEVQRPILYLLLKMLETYNPKHDPQTRQLNADGATILREVAAKRGINVE